MPKPRSRLTLASLLIGAVAALAACRALPAPSVAPAPVADAEAPDTAAPRVLPLAGGTVLYVLDGRVLKTPAGTAMPDEIRALTPERIAAVEVLKGTAAKERYGSMGENGVVMITTRKDAGDKQKS